MTSASGSRGIAPATQRLLVIFQKGEAARFLSHLDLIATLEYSIRRAGLPVALSEGFNPRPRMSLAAPLPVGYTGEREILELYLREARDPAVALRDLQGALPAGLIVIAIEEIGLEGKSAGSRVKSATYRARLPEPAVGLDRMVSELLACSAIDVEDEREGAVRRRNIRPMIISVEILDPRSLRLTVSQTGQGTVRPELIIRQMGLATEGVRIVRERLEVAEQSDGDGAEGV
ncbi:MAG: TIGR03936 family radical SAM-associated protein [Chloroflexota bacterium]